MNQLKTSEAKAAYENVSKLFHRLTEQQIETVSEAVKICDESLFVGGDKCKITKGRLTVLAEITEENLQHFINFIRLIDLLKPAARLN